MPCCTLEYVYEHRLRPEPDRITIARLHGCALRHARFRPPTRDEIAAAAAELLAITTDPELLAETAGVLYGTGRGSSYQDRDLCAAVFLTAAGADPDWTWYWAAVGHERAERARRHVPWQGWEPSGAPRAEVPLVLVRAEFAGLPLLPSEITHTQLGHRWKVTGVKGKEMRRTGRGNKVADWRYRLTVDGPLPGNPGEAGEFAVLMEWTGEGWGIRPLPG